MKNVYDMVSGEFIEDDSVPMQEVGSSYDDNNFYPQSTLQLQLVEQHSPSTTICLPADLALQTFLMSK